MIQEKLQALKTQVELLEKAASDLGLHFTKIMLHPISVDSVPECAAALHESAAFVTDSRMHVTVLEISQNVELLLSRDATPDEMSKSEVRA